MRNIFIFTFCFLMLHFCITAKAQNNTDESLGLPGDNLNLYAVMRLFQESSTLELFEKNLNDESSRINNLDLNGDGQIDYISVMDNVEGKTHAIVMQVAINENENQDVACFYVKNDAHNHVQIQLIGDESLYGKDYIIEPNSVRKATPNPGFSGNQGVVRESVVVEYNNWPIIGLLFLPTYVAWHSPWYYGYYPRSWRPWQPLFWHSYYGYHSHYNQYYKKYYIHTNHYRDPHFREHYFASQRRIAPSVVKRRNEGFYKTTYLHPESRKEGSDTYNRLHPGNLNHPANRSAGMQRSANTLRRPTGIRALNTSEINRSNAHVRTSGTTRQPVNTFNSKASIRQVTTRTNPQLNVENTRSSTQIPANRNLNRASNNQGPTHSSNVQGATRSMVKTPATQQTGSVAKIKKDFHRDEAEIR